MFRSEEGWVGAEQHVGGVEFISCFVRKSEGKEAVTSLPAFPGNRSSLRVCLYSSYHSPAYYTASVWEQPAVLQGGMINSLCQTTSQMVLTFSVERRLFGENQATFSRQTHLLTIFFKSRLSPRWIHVGFSIFAFDVSFSSYASSEHKITTAEEQNRQETEKKKAVMSQTGDCL